MALGIVSDIGPYGGSEGARRPASRPTPGAGYSPYASPTPAAAPTPGAGAIAPPAPPSLSGFDINSLPGVADALALQQQGYASLDARLKAARDQAIIGFGDPGLASLAGFGIDPATGQFAQQNYDSGNATLARLDHAHQLAARGIVNQLAGHGMLFSGETGYREGEENRGYGNSLYDARQSVLAQLSSLYDNYLSGRQGLDQAVNQARMQAWESFLANPDAYASMFGVGGTGAGGGAAPVAAAGPVDPSMLTGMESTQDSLARILQHISGGNSTAGHTGGGQAKMT